MPEPKLYNPQVYNDPKFYYYTNGQPALVEKNDLFYIQRLFKAFIAIPFKFIVAKEK